MQLQTVEPLVREYIVLLEAGLKEYKNKYLEMKERHDLLIYKRFGLSSEQLRNEEKQVLLFSEEVEQTKAVETIGQEERSDVKSYNRKKPGRKAINSLIPREERLVDICESEKICACGASLSQIGEESSEKLHIIAPGVYVEKTICPKYACRTCEGTEDEQAKTVRIAKDLGRYSSF
jgi:hypothetical protein